MKRRSPTCLMILTNFYEGWLDEEEVADLLDDLNKLL